MNNSAIRALAQCVKPFVGPVEIRRMGPTYRIFAVEAQNVSAEAFEQAIDVRFFTLRRTFSDADRLKRATAFLNDLFTRPVCRADCYQDGRLVRDLYWFSEEPDTSIGGRFYGIPTPGLRVYTHLSEWRFDAQKRRFVKETEYRLCPNAVKTVAVAKSWYLDVYKQPEGYSYTVERREGRPSGGDSRWTVADDGGKLLYESVGSAYRAARASYLRLRVKKKVSRTP